MPAYFCLVFPLHAADITSFASVEIPAACLYLWSKILQSFLVWEPRGEFSLVALEIVVMCWVLPLEAVLPIPLGMETKFVSAKVVQ